VHLFDLAALCLPSPASSITKVESNKTSLGESLQVAVGFLATVVPRRIINGYHRTDLFTFLVVFLLIVFPLEEKPRFFLVLLVKGVREGTFMLLVVLEWPPHPFWADICTIFPANGTNAHHTTTSPLPP